MPFATSTVLAIAATTATVASTGVAVYSGVQGAKAQEAAAEANAANLRDAAKAEETANIENIQRASREAQRRLAGIRASLAGTGTQLNDGTNQDILGNASNRLEVAIADNSRASQQRARQLRTSAALTRFQGSQASAAATTQAVGTVLQGASSVTGQTYNNYRAGAFG